MSPTSYQTAPPRISIIATLGGSVKRRAKAEISRGVIEGVIARIMVGRIVIARNRNGNAGEQDTNLTMRTKRLCLERFFRIRQDRRKNWHPIWLAGIESSIFLGDVRPQRIESIQ